ncbi:spore cortex biosynthesis protein YabQ [Niallia endozanthoxylica]|uniref:Spore cortex biosynthesis protein YabQ n=1 Tax=Niallia endozanthoxylica TaxID=2036016 RepID=A0A5J5GVD8_9BACI|nr:spore cortex biosynthesis protein YabQ [Niallia endozanthoxylica]KAA9011997.1 spore cortex biosynthesis protein YabQ [Niallia endozanthoxylica]
MTLTTQFMTMLAMIGMGTYFGAALDTYNRFLQRSKRKSWLIFINDILFWTFQGLFIFYVLFHVNQGELRFYIFLALLCGFAAYQSLCKQIYLRCLEWLISFVISVSRFIVKLFRILIYKPILALISTIITTVIMIGKGLFVLLKTLWKCAVFTIIILLKPIKWIFLLFWKLFPKPLKKYVEKLYNGLAGKWRPVKNTIKNVIAKWKKGNKGNK